MSLKVVISGYYGYGNAGDEAILESILEIFKSAAAEKGQQIDFTVFSSKPRKTKAAYHVKAIRRLGPWMIVKSIKTCDLFVSGGGSLLQDKTGLGLSVFYYAGLMFLANLLGKPVVMYAQGIGPVTKNINRLIIRQVLKKLDLVIVRDRKSKKELISMGVKEHLIQLTVDPVFYHWHEKERRGDINKIINNLDTARPLIGISVRSWLGHNEYIQEIARAADRLVDETGAQILIYPMFPAVDYSISLELKQLMSNPAHVIKEALSLKDTLFLFSRFRLLIGVRFHSLVFAACTGVPAVGIGYDPKVYSLLDQLGLKKPGSLDGLHSDTLFRECLSLWDNQDPVKARINQKAASFRHETISCGKKVLTRFLPQEDGEKSGALKVLHLISGGDTGGAKKHVFTLIKELQKNSNVTLICLIDGQFYQDGLKFDLNIHTINQRQRYNLLVINQLRNYIKKHNIQLVHCHGARANFMGAIMKRIYAIPTVTTIHSDYKLDFWGDIYKKILYTFLNAMSLRSINNFIVISDNFKQMLISRRFPENRIHVVYNGIDFSSAPPLRPRAEILREYGLEIPETAKIVGILGRLHRVKGHDFFIRSAAIIHQQHPHIHFLIGGDGAEKKRLMALGKNLGLQDNLHFVGMVDNPYDFLQTLDINTLTSYSESFPYVLLEGALLKKPTVSIVVGGVDRLIIDGRTGLLVHERDEAEFAGKVVQLLTHRELAGKLGENLYLRGKEKYSLTSLVQRHLRIYRDLLKTR